MNSLILISPSKGEAFNQFFLVIAIELLNRANRVPSKVNLSNY